MRKYLHSFLFSIIAVDCNVKVSLTVLSLYVIEYFVLIWERHTAIIYFLSLTQIR